MSLEKRLYELAKHVQDLLCCDSVSVLLGCAEATLCHPLLKKLPTNSAALHVTTVGSIMPPLFNEGVTALCDIASQTGTIWGIECVRLSDGSAGSLVACPLETLDGNLGLLLCTYKKPGDFRIGEFLLLQQYLSALQRDIEDLLEREQDENSHVREEAKANMQHELVSMVSHELRVPLAAIKGYTALLQTYGYGDTSDEVLVGVMSPEHRQRYLNAIMEQVNCLEVLVSDLLDVSQLQAGHFALHPVQVDLEALCLSVIKQIQCRVDQQQPGYYNFRFQIENDLPFAWADPARVRQVLINLIENAVKYSPNGGPIEITLCVRLLPDCEPVHLQTQNTPWPSLPARCICVTVRDWGVGIPLLQQTALFKPFVRLEQPLIKSVPGNGLGLYISRKLVEAMNGQMLLTSEEGQGTCVTFILPIVPSSVAIVPHKVKHSLC